MGNFKRLTHQFKENTFSQNAFIYTVSTFCNSATPFILLPILTRYLTTTEYGMVSMFTIVAGFLLPFMGMSVPAAVMRKFAEEREDESREYLFNCFLIAAGATVLIVLVCECFKGTLAKIAGLNVDLFCFMYLYVTSSYVFNLALAIMQIKQNVKRYAVFQNAATLLNLLISIFTILCLQQGMMGRIYGLTFSKFIFAVAGCIYIGRTIGVAPRIRKKYLLDEITNFGLPMIPTEIKATILTCTDRIFITNMISVSETGIYSVGNQFAMPILLLAQAFNLAYVPWLYGVLSRNEEKEKRNVVRMTYLYFVIAVALAILWSVTAGFLMQWVAGDGYERATQYVLWLSLGYAFTGMHMMVVNYIYYMKKIKGYAGVTIFIIILNIILNYAFMNMFGTIGAAVATTISNFVSFLLTWIMASRVCDMPWFGKLKKRRPGDE